VDGDDLAVAQVTFDEFWQSIGAPPRNQRLGQHAFNLLYRVRPDLTEAIRGTIYDPFHSNLRLADFYTYLKEHWND
jgi:hypothetical protein